MCKKRLTILCVIPLLWLPLISCNVTIYDPLFDDPIHTVIYNANGATEGTVPEDTKKYFPGQTVTVQDNPGDLLRTGYIYNYWNSRADGSGTHYSPGDTFTLNNDNRTIYAEWIPVTYTITYDLDGSTNNPGNPASYTIETPAILLLVPVKPGFTLEGWYSDSSYTTLVTAIPTGSTGDITLYALFTAFTEDTAIWDDPNTLWDQCNWN